MIIIKKTIIIVLCIFFCSPQMNTSPVAVTSGGTSHTTLTQDNLLIGNDSSALTLLAPNATSGIPLISQGASSDPAYGIMIVAGGGTGATSFTPYGVIFTGTTPTGPFQSVASLGTAGDPLVSQGDNVLPIFETMPVTGGGTGRTTLTQYNLLVGNDTSAINFIAPSITTGIPLVSQGLFADPDYGTMNVPGGGTGLALTTSYAILCGGTTSTGNLQQVSSVGTTEEVLTSQGVSALPIWNPQVQRATVTLTSPQVKSLYATPITIIPAPGPGYMINVISCVVKKHYGGTDVWTADASQTLRLNYTDGFGTTIISTALANSSIISADDRIAFDTAPLRFGITYSTVGNQAVVIFNPVATEISGNAANDNTIVVSLLYTVLAM